MALSPLRQLQLRYLLGCCAIGVVAAGCGGASKQLVDRRQAAQQALAQGVEAFEQQDFAAAAEHFAQAVDGGGLNADSYVEAQLKRALSLAGIDQYDQAHALLDDLESGAPDLDRVYAARSAIFARQGRQAESRAALAKARSINRRIRPYEY